MDVELSGQERLLGYSWVPCWLGGYLSVRGYQLSFRPQLLHLYQVQWWPQMGSDGQGHQRMISDLVFCPAAVMRCSDWNNLKEKGLSTLILSAMFHPVREVKATRLDVAGHVTSTVRRREWWPQASALVHTLLSLLRMASMPHPGNGPIHNEDGFPHSS